MEHRLFRDKTACCFSGHRPAGLPAGGDLCSPEMILLRRNLIYAVEAAACAGVTDYYAGGARGFDLMAADAVLLLRDTFPQLRLHLALPSPVAQRGYPAADRARAAAHMAAAAEVWYAMDAGSGVYAFHARDRYMVEHADCMIAYLSQSAGGTFYTVSRAREKGIPILNLAAADLPSL